MKISKFLFSAAMLAALLTGCTPAASPSGPLPETTAVPTETTLPESSAPACEDAVDALLSQMTLRQKVGQLFIVRPDALDPAQTTEQVSNAKAEGVTALTGPVREMLSEYPVGGIVLFGKNILSPEQLTDFNAALQEASSIPLFLCVDEEGGLVARLANHDCFDLPGYQSAAAVGASGDPADALEMGRTIGAYVKEYGFNLDFAPVADVNTNPDNPVIGSRAFSSDPETTAQMASAFRDGLEENGIIAVFKHFPGHGDTAEDSHSGLAVTYRTLDALHCCEFLPFLEAGPRDMVMVGHIALPNVTGDTAPATLSRELVTGILREDLGFEGLIITDAMDMGAIAEAYDAGEAAVAALAAGCDILLMPEDLPGAFDAVIAALEDGTLSMDWLNATVRRILAFKQLHGIITN